MDSADTALRELARERGPEKSFCPSEAARRWRPQDWREAMDEVRKAARRLARSGELVITQGGKVVPPDADIKGPIRLRLGRN
ncbi:MAG: DUF3253 domain-containing protein [Opitutales bacterium]